MTTLHIENLQIKRRHVVCDETNLTFRTGEIWGVLGPNGVGKTSFLHALCGILKPTAGQITINTIQLQSLSEKKRARKIGIVLQNQAYYLPQTVMHFCEAALFANHQIQSTNIDRVLTTLQLSHLKFKLLSDLSGGELQRVKLASILLQSPDIYLLDEPCNHLDIKNQIFVLKQFKSLAQKQNKLIIAALHNLNFAQRFCDHIILIQPPQLLAGPKEMILTEANLSQSFSHPIQKIHHERDIFWQAKLS